MNKDDLGKNSIKSLWKGRTACVLTLAVSVFLCVLTLLEVLALKMEWNIPVLGTITGGADSFIFEEYRNEEMTLDDSVENEPIEEAGGELGQELVTESNEILTDDSLIGFSQVQNLKSEEDETELVEEEDEFPYYIKVNRQQNCVTVYTKDANGEYTIPYKAIVCSTGLYNATPTGTFHLSNKYRWRELHGGVYGQYASRITGGILFHSVPYRRKSEDSLYADKYNKLGQQASMGCIRLTVEDAKWIVDNCPSGTTVEIYDDEDPGPLGKPEAAKIDTDSPNKGWDPTDPDEDNPWKELSEDE